MSEIRKLDAVTDRVETGAVQFGQDWPGLFIRGDNCIAILMSLHGIQKMLKNVEPKGFMEQLYKIQLDSLVKLIAEPIVHPHKEDFLRRFSDTSELT